MDPISFFGPVKTIKQVESKLVKTVIKEEASFDEFADMNADDTDMIRLVELEEEKLAAKSVERRREADLKILETKSNLDKSETISRINESVNVKHETKKVQVSSKGAPDIVDIVDIKHESNKSPVGREELNRDDSDVIEIKSTTKSPAGKSAKKGKAKNTDLQLIESEINGGNDAKPVSAKTAGYRLFLAKEKAGPSIPHTHRPTPIGAPDCLAGFTFVFTGDLDSLSREDSEGIVKRYGGRVVKSLSKKTSYVVFGSNPGPAKTEKCKTLGLKELNEDDFYTLINSFAPSLGVKVQEIQAKPTSAHGILKGINVAKELVTFSASVPKAAFSSQLWTDKYKPRTYEEVVGNGAILKKMSSWLKDWCLL